MDALMRQMKLGLFISAGGHHIAGWRHPDSYPFGFDIKNYVAVAEAAERACFDLVFLADVYSLTPEGKRQDHMRLEPTTTLSALAMVTNRIGLIGTATTTYNEPFNVARKFASLDHISHGRSGWNIVTSNSPLEAYNFGFDAHPNAEKRYEIANEFVEVVRGLWDSWEEGAVPIDKTQGVFFDPEKLHVLNHDGEHFKVRGPLTIPRSPQGQPVLVQAGSSEDGRALAASVAEVIFTIQRDLTDGQAFYADIKKRVIARGRNPDHVVIMPGVVPIVGRTRQEAIDKYESLQALIHPEAGLKALSRAMGTDLMQVDVEGPLPDIDPSKIPQSRGFAIIEEARRNNMTVRQIYERLVASKGHRMLIGTAVDVADGLHEWFASQAADGFTIMPAEMQGGTKDFAELVIPELRRRGLFRSSYEGDTLREHLGLPVPPHHTPVPMQ